MPSAELIKQPNHGSEKTATQKNETNQSYPGRLKQEQKQLQVMINFNKKIINNFKMKK